MTRIKVNSDAYLFAFCTFDKGMNTFFFYSGNEQIYLRIQPNYMLIRPYWTMWQQAFRHINVLGLANGKYSVNVPLQYYILVI